MRTLILLVIFTALVVMTLRQPGESFTGAATRLANDWWQQAPAAEELVEAAREHAAPEANPDKDEAKTTSSKPRQNPGANAAQPASAGAKRSGTAEAHATGAPDTQGPPALRDQASPQTGDAGLPATLPSGPNVQPSRETNAKRASTEHPPRELYREAAKLLEDTDP